MKNLIKINILKPVLFIVLLLIVNTGCEDKLLEPYENTVYATDVDYSVGSDMILPLYGAYQAFYTRGWNEHLTIGNLGDDVNAAGDQAPMQEQDKFIYLASHWNINALWQAWYGDIIRMFTAISDIEKYRPAANNDQLADQYIAECRVLRSWFYLQIGKTWGGGIIIDQLDNIQSQPVSNKAEMMQYVVDEMDEVISLLPDMHPNKRTDVPGGVTKYTALAIQALAYQELEDYQGVADATSQITSSSEFSLMPDYYNMFNKISSKFGSEFILEIHRSDYGQGQGDAFYQGALWNPYGIGGWNPVVTGASSGWGFYEPTMKYITFMLDRGETDRLEASVEFTPNGITELENTYGNPLPGWIDNENREGDVFNNNGRLLFGSGKHIQPSTELTAGRTRTGENKNFIVIRYAEILLMHAEALTRGATSSSLTADQAVNLVRQRAGLGTISGVTTDDVLDEKYAELAMEWGIRFRDMVRSGNTAELNHDGRTYTDDKAYLPFPSNQVSELPQLADGVQN